MGLSPSARAIVSATARIAAIVAVAGTLLIGASGRDAEASGGVVARISIADQRMEVIVDGRTAYAWKVSTAGRGYRTPRGTFRPTRMHRMWYSRKYDNAPMPHSVFFHGGYAVHATDAIKRLGQPASHGCIRLHPSNAANFFDLVKTYGASNTRIVITE